MRHRTRPVTTLAVATLALGLSACLPPLPPGGGGGTPTTTTAPTTTTTAVDCEALGAEAIAANTAAIQAANEYTNAVERGDASQEELSSLYDRALAASAASQALHARFDELCL